MAIFATKKFTASTSRKGLRVTPKSSTRSTPKATKRSSTTTKWQTHRAGATTSRNAKKR